MKTRFLTFVSVFVLLFGTTLAPLTASAQTQTANSFPFTADGTATPETGGPAITGPVTVEGLLTIDSFDTSTGKLMAKGTFTGKVTSKATGLVHEVTEPVPWEAPVISINNHTLGGAAAAEPSALDDPELSIAQAPSCNILNLVLGPLHLNLLGLVVDLNQVILNITGATGAGNLLGNLLCAITGLLDTPGGLANLAILTNLLNALLGILQL